MSKKKFFKERFYTILDEIFAGIIISALGYLIITFRENVINFFGNIFQEIKGFSVFISGMLALIFLSFSIFIWRRKLKLVPKRFRRDWDVPVKERGGKKNPFIVGTPVFGHNFYGRSTEINEIYDRISRRESCSIISNRRVGKTSLLLHLSHERTIKTIGRNFGIDPRKTIFIYFSTSAFESEPQFWKGLYDKLAKASMSQIGYDAAKEVDFHDFSNLLTDVNSRGLSVKLLFDEFDMAINQMSRPFFERMRSFPGQYDVCYVVVTLKSLWDYLKLDNKISSPFPNIFHPIELGLLSDDEAREMVKNIFDKGGFSFERRDIEFLLEIAGPHPFFLQKAGDAFVNVYVSPPKKKSPLLNKNKIYEVVERKFCTSAEPFFEEYFNKLNHKEQDVILKIAKNIPIKNKHKIIETLKQRVLLSENGNQRAPFSKSFNAFLITRATKN